MTPDAWEYDEYLDEPLPPGAAPLSRYLKGSFVIVSTRSPYNLDPKTYDARHEKLGETAFLAYMQQQKALWEARAAAEADVAHDVAGAPAARPPRTNY